MIKFALSVLIIVIVLGLIGGAVQFESTHQNWSLIVNKEAATNSVQNGVTSIYNFIEELIGDTDAK